MSVRLISIEKWADEKSPFFFLKGAWLADAGFTIGKKAVIEEEHGLIIIKLVDFEEA